MFHHYSVRPFVTLCRRALCGCLLLLLTVPAAMGDTQLPAAAYPQRHGDLTPREQAMAVKARNTSSPTTNRRPGWSTRSTTTLQPPCGTAPPTAALTAARELGIIDKEQFDQRLIKFRYAQHRAAVPKPDAEQGLQHHHRAKGRLSQQARRDRLLIHRYRQNAAVVENHQRALSRIANDVDNVVLRWDFSHIIDDCGTLYGANLDANKQPVYVQKAGWAMRNTPPAVSSCGVLHLPGLPRGALPVGGHLLCSGPV